MDSAILTEHESACRSAHEQVQLLQHLYERMAESRQSGDAAGRIGELRADRQMLVAKLKELGLLRKEPDPEREGLLDLASGLKRVLGVDDETGMNERLITEEQEYLHLCEQLAAHDDDERIAKSIDRTRAAIERRT